MINPEKTSRLLFLDKVSVQRGGKFLLRDISFTMHDREIIMIIGPNGAGKTTLARLIIGLIQKTSGTLKRSRNIRIGYVPQTFKIENSCPVTVREYLTSTTHRFKDLDFIMKIVEIESLLSSLLIKISGGELRRVLLARALLTGKDLLVLDEPMNCLDIQGQNQFYRILENINTLFGCAVLIISHDLFMVMKHAQKILCINKSICCAGTPTQIKTNPDFQKLFDTYAEHVSIYHHDDHQVTSSDK